MNKYIISASVSAALFAVSAQAGGLGLPPQPVVTPPAQPLFSWTGPYAGISAGTTRTKSKRQTWGERETYGERDVIEHHDAETRPYNKADAFFSARDHGLKSFAPVAPVEHLAHCQAFDFIVSQLNCGGFSTSDYEYGAFDRGEYFGEYLTDEEIQERYGAVEIPERDPIVTQEAWDEVVGTEEYVTGSERYVTGSETVRESHSTLGIFAGYRWQTASDIVLGGELGYHHYNSTDAFEAKAQLGYAINRALPYLTAGYDFTDDTTIYGAGFDYALTDRWIAGVEYTHADKTGTDRLSARLAFKF